MADRPFVRGRDLNRCVHFAGSRAADEQGCLQTTTLHFIGVENHFIERRRDETAHSDKVRFVFFCGF